MGISKDLRAWHRDRDTSWADRDRDGCQGCSGSGRGFFFKGGQMGYCKIAEVREAERGLVFAVSALNGRQLLQFRVLDTQTGPGQSTVRVGSANTSKSRPERHLVYRPTASGSPASART